MKTPRRLDEHGERGARRPGARWEPAPEASLEPADLERHVLSLQSTAGNSAVAALLARRARSADDRHTARLLRQIVITKVDFNPDVAKQLELAGQPIDDAFKNFALREEDVKEMRKELAKFLSPNSPQNYPDSNKPIGGKAQRTEIHARLPQLKETVNVSGGDIPTVAAELAKLLRGETALTDPEKERLALAVQTAIGSVAFAMKPSSAGLFEQLLKHAGGGSRAKGVPTQIQHTQLPGELHGPVQQITTQIRTRNQGLVPRATSVLAETPPPAERLSLAATEDMQFIRTVHTNESGWLPTVPAPADVQTFEAPFIASLPPAVRNSLTTNGKVSTHVENTQYATAINGHLNPLTARQRARLCWGCYALNAGSGTLYPFVEFSIGHKELNRLIYDYVNGTFYVSFHYHWHKGFNPFFEVRGIPDV